jgi:hypothetical protein
MCATGPLVGHFKRVLYGRAARLSTTFLIESARLGRTVSAVELDSGRRVVDDRIRAVLRLAKRGKTADGLAKLLGPFQPRGGQSRRSYYDWGEEPDSLSAPALATAIELAGPEGVAALIGPEALRELLDRYCGDLPPSGAPTRDPDVAALVDRVAQVEAEMRELRRKDR